MKDEIKKIKEEIENKFENKKFWPGSIEGFEEIKANYEKTYLELQEKTIESKIIYFLNRFPECKVECEIKTEKMPNFATYEYHNDRYKLNLQCFSANDNILKLYFEKGDLLGSGFGRVLLTSLEPNSGIKEKEGIDYHIKQSDEILMTISTKKKNITEEMLTPFTSTGFNDCIEIKLGEKTEICKARDVIIRDSMEAKIRHAFDVKALNATKATSSLSKSFVTNKLGDVEDRKRDGANWKTKSTTIHNFLY